MLKKVIDTLGFYGDPETYFAIGFFADPPCGGFMEDFRDTEGMGRKPGNKAELMLGELLTALPKEVADRLIDEIEDENEEDSP